ncbi:glycosyltransferase family 4 protein [Neobacillus pocheonensis]|uniref:Glycosyltransferase family 4 protein n=1 Tax=Neobacillus pocheonensis TaxID=363869 RepID=A0ABT0WID3_9BACI|nr:glycosyltransferase family 4 protein [Neobacillus pocheonensis]
MKIAFITNLRAPYRTLQLNEFSKIKNITLNVYYTDKQSENRVWDVNKAVGFKEIDLDGINLFKKLGYLNKGLVKIVTTHDLLILGGYEKPTYIVLSILCRILKKPYILLFDGISTHKLEENKNNLKTIIKKLVIKKADFILGNGNVSKRYFSEIFSYPNEKILNQYLTVDTKKIESMYKDKEKYKIEYREKLGIKKDEKVLIYSGRLINIKNVESVIEAVSKLKKRDLVFLITGGGILEEHLKQRAKELKIKLIITGFLPDQDELFKHYFVGDALILPSFDEAWGLVVNEALVAGLPVLVSRHCGCANDLVIPKQNGYIFNPFDVNEISKCIENVISKDDNAAYSKKSKEIALNWTFENSRKNLEHILSNYEKMAAEI